MLYCRILFFIFIAASVVGRSLAFEGLDLHRFFRPIICYFGECCDHERWMPTDFTDLRNTLRKKVHGQHLVVDPVIKHLTGHARSSPSKALVFSFHGSTGIGKTYVSSLMVEKMFTKGMKSKYVHFFSGVEFKHKGDLPEYQEQLRQKIVNEVKKCHRSVFIFDEMDKMPAGLIDTLQPYLDYHTHIGGVDYRNAIYIFLSNSAGHDIADKTLSHWEERKEREAITLKEMEEIIHLPAYNIESGLFKSAIIDKNLITAYIPFLPLERRHVKQCIKDSLVAKGYRMRKEILEVKVQEIADELTFYPKGIDLFSTSGCKRVDDKVDFIMVSTYMHREL